MNYLNRLKRSVRLERLRGWVDCKHTMLLTLVCLVVFPVQRAAASDIAARTCAATDVQAAIDAANTGDRVIVPSGACVWNTSVVISGKNITFQGAGKASTMITFAGTYRLEMTTTSSRVTGFGFSTSTTATPPMVVAEGQNWRVDNNRFEGTGGTFVTGVWAYGARAGAHPTGVIDHNDFINARVLVYGDGLDNWTSPSTIGNPNQTGVVYVEDSNFNFNVFGNAIDAELSARYVFRYNTVTNTQLEAHSNQGTRNSRSWEIYNNVFNSNRGWFAPMFIRGGTGVVFNNTITGDFSFTFTLDNVRSFSDLGYANGKCDGTSSWDGNVSYGSPCRDQIGRGQDAAGPFPQPQASEPAYFWNNTFNGSPTVPRVANCASTIKPGGSCADIQLNRDYFNATRPGYTPYTYPHPLVTGSAPLPPPPAPPSASDTTPPLPGNSGAIAASVGASGATLSWVKATDDVSAQSALQYEVRLSTKNDITTVANAEAFGAIVKAYTADISSTVVPGWTPGTTYYFNVIVKDVAGNKSSYAMTGATMPVIDSTAPVPGNSGLMTSSVTTSSATLGWTKATDNTTSQSSLLYEVRRSTSNNIGSVAMAETNGTIVLNYSPDIATANNSGLSPSTTYYYNVIVKDGAGNKAVYASKNVTTDAIPDTTSPVPGSSGTISSMYIMSSNATLSWGRATDNVTAQPQLQYELRQSLSNNIDTIANAEANGSIVRSYASDLTSAYVTGLSGGTTYYFNVIVKDSAGNKAIYNTRTVTTMTSGDTTAPVPGNGGAMTSTSVGSTSFALGWTRATDDVTAPTLLQYEVRRSSSDNIDTVLHADAYGTIAQNYATNISSANITGLTPNTTYYFNVIVKDEAGNRSVYMMTSVTTATAVDTSAPTPGNFGTISTAALGPSSVTLNWTKATDNTSVPEELLYEVRRSLNNNLGTVALAETNGVVAQPYSPDIATVNITGLASNTNYYFTVIVKDAAGNKAVYQSVNVKTALDTVPPVPGGSGWMTSTSTSSSITLSWLKATDNATASTALRYEVRLSGTNNIGSVANAEANGTIAVAYTVDSSSATINGLAAGTTYYLNVMVKDEANNKAAYQVKSETTGGKKITQLNNGKGPLRRSDNVTETTSGSANDTTPPIPGAGGLVSESGISTTGVTLRWTTAVDNLSPKAMLRYKVVQSAQENINTVAEAETNGTVILDFTNDTSSYVVKGLKNVLQYYFTVVVVDEAGNKAVYGTAGDLADQYAFSANAGVMWKTASALNSPLKLNQVQVSPVQGSIAPAGLAILKSSTSVGLRSAAAMTLSGGIKIGSIYATLSDITDTADGVKTGISMANPSASDIEISFLFTDANGIDIRSGVYTLLANHQISAFLDESPFNGPSVFNGTFTFSASAPISATGTRTMTQKDGDFLLEALPVVDGTSSNSQLVPLFVDGRGWSTELVLMNRTASLQSGTVQFFGQRTADEAASALDMTIDGVSSSRFSYSIPPHAIARLVTIGTDAAVRMGSVRITPGSSSGGSTPDVQAIVAFKVSGETVSESTISALPTGTAFRSYAEVTKTPEWVSTSWAIVNATNVPNTINFELTRLDGTPISHTSVTLPPNGQSSQYVLDLFPDLNDGFQGLLRVTSSGPVAMATLHCMYNLEGRFMFTSTPALNESTVSPTAGLAFPLVAAGAGYDTQMILFGRAGQAGEGEILIISKDGVPQASSSLGIAR